MGRQHSESLDALPDSFHYGLRAPTENTLLPWPPGQATAEFHPHCRPRGHDASIATRRPSSLRPPPRRLGLPPDRAQRVCRTEFPKWFATNAEGGIGVEDRTLSKPAA